MIDWGGTRVLVTGGGGFLGEYLVRALAGRGAQVLPIPRSADYNLVDGAEVRRVLDDTKPDLVFHLAARVGGIGANQKRPATFFYENAMMGIQLLHECAMRKVSKLVMVGTVCSYPKVGTIPFVEHDLWNGHPEETNAPYGIAKRLLHTQSVAYRQQYGFNSVLVVPANLYGPGDSSDHVIPDLFRKIYAARHEAEVVLWGDGTPTREFLHVADCANGLVLAAEHYNDSEPLNLGSGEEVTISSVAHIISGLIGTRANIRFDNSMPNGQPRRKLDSTKAAKIGFVASRRLMSGMRETYKWMVENELKG